jgi:nitroimidazol reductase NimA-like FMN-containing flavoprotein (pyridoxamine 5'-phosphate oxidase superfamily)
MTPEEMSLVISRCRWATICSVCEDATPYAIEATPFFMGNAHCFMINPRGGTWKNLRANPQVLLKYTLATDDLSVWAGVSCRGPGEFVHDADALREGWGLLGKVMGADYSLAAEKFARCTDRSPLFRVAVETMTGRCGAAKNEDLVLP